MSAPRVDPHIRAAVVRRWIDGDTVSVDIDRGMNEWGHDVHLRLRAAENRVYAEELGSPGGDKALVFQATRAPVGSRVVVQTFKPREDSLGRYIAVMWLDGVDLGQALLNAGLATPVPFGAPR